MSKEREWKCNNNNHENNQSDFAVNDLDELFKLLFGEELEEFRNSNHLEHDCMTCDMKSMCTYYLSKEKEEKESKFSSESITDSDKINEVASMIMKLQHDVDNMQNMINDINRKVIIENNNNISENDIVDRIYKKLKKKLINQNSENNKYITELSVGVTSTIVEEYNQIKSSTYQNQLIMESIISELKNISENINLLNTAADEQKPNAREKSSKK